MSYSGTVYCSYCGKRGHNKRTCGTYRQWLIDHPDSVSAKWEKTRRERLKEQRKATPRRCRYCLETGHNLRSCRILKDDRHLLQQVLARSRGEIKEKMLLHGFGVGALVSARKHGWTTEKYIGMVTAIRWEETDTAAGITYCIEPLNWNIGTLRWGRRPFPGTISDITDIIAPIDRADVEKNIPLEWLRGANYVESRYFPKGQPRTMCGTWLADGAPCDQEPSKYS